MKRVLSEWVTPLLLTPRWSLLIKMSFLFSCVHQGQQSWVLHLTSTFSLSVSPSKISSDYIWADSGIAFSSLQCTCEIKKKFFKLFLSHSYIQGSQWKPQVLDAFTWKNLIERKAAVNIPGCHILPFIQNCTHMFSKWNTLWPFLCYMVSWFNPS